MASVLPLEEAWGGNDFWDDDAAEEGRYQPFLESGLSDSREWEDSWLALQKEMRETAAWLDEEAEGVLEQDAETGGWNRERQGELRERINGPRMAAGLKLLRRALELWPDQGWRPVWSLPQRDKLSSAWCQLLPYPDTAMSPAEFSEVVAAHLCMPSPVCATKLGEALPGRGRQRPVVDQYGDRVCAANLPGNGHKIRHDEMKNELQSKMRWAGMASECEVFGMFAGDIGQAGLARIDRGRKRQGIIPDFKIPGGEGEYDAVLADLKFITGIENRYPRDPAPTEEPKKAVDRRAALVNKEYQQHALRLDIRHNNIKKAGRGEVQQAGPVMHRLSRFGVVEGWCFGVWGEASSRVHSLLHNIVEARMKVMDQQPRRRKQRGKEAEQAKLIGSLRQQVSLLAVRANARLLINRVESHIGQGCKEAANRRSFTVQEEWRQRRLRRAQALTVAQGRSLIRRGEFEV